jgi:hypothetical protein
MVMDNCLLAVLDVGEQMLESNVYMQVNHWPADLLEFRRILE